MSTEMQQWKYAMMLRIDCKIYVCLYQRTYCYDDVRTCKYLAHYCHFVMEIQWSSNHTTEVCIKRVTWFSLSISCKISSIVPRQLVYGTLRFSLLKWTEPHEIPSIRKYIHNHFWFSLNMNLVEMQHDLYWGTRGMDRTNMYLVYSMFS